MTAASQSDLIKRLQKARRVSTPLTSVATTDPAATIDSLVAGLNHTLNGSEVPILAWDISGGLKPKNQAGRTAMAAIIPPDGKDVFAENPHAFLLAALKAPEETVLIMLQADAFLDQVGLAQAVWNLRDKFIDDNRMLILMGTDPQVPPLLTHDVVPYSEELPTREELREVVSKSCEEASVDETSVDAERAVDATVGLSKFAASNACALSLKMSSEGVASLDLDELWRRKNKMIEATKGLRVLAPDQSFNEIGGHETLISFIKEVFGGRRRPSSVIFIDEIEKAMAGTKGDLSGTSQDALGHLLTYMQTSWAVGLILVGPPGTGKSAIAQAAGQYGDCPTIALDLGETKGSLVGQSQQLVRSATRVIDAVSAGRSFWIATSNNVAALPTELKRRFNFGTWFCDLPSASERKDIWKIWRNNPVFESVKGKIPNDKDWTGDEIRKCCDMADRFDKELKDVIPYISPIAVSAKEDIAKMRKQADGVFLSTSKKGVYRFSGDAESTPGGRAMNLGPSDN